MLAYLTPKLTGAAVNQRTLPATAAGQRVAAIRRQRSGTIGRVEAGPQCASLPLPAAPVRQRWCCWKPAALWPNKKPRRCHRPARPRRRPEVSSAVRGCGGRDDRCPEPGEPLIVANARAASRGNDRPGARLSAAMVGVEASDKVDPSDMLITSSWSDRRCRCSISTTLLHSIAATVMVPGAARSRCVDVGTRRQLQGQASCW